MSSILTHAQWLRQHAKMTRLINGHPWETRLIIGHPRQSLGTYFTKYWRLIIEHPWDFQVWNLAPLAITWHIFYSIIRGWQSGTPAIDMAYVALIYWGLIKSGTPDTGSPWQLYPLYFSQLFKTGNRAPLTITWHIIYLNIWRLIIGHPWEFQVWNLAPLAFTWLISYSIIRGW